MEVASLQELGAYLKSHREAKGISREELALRIKVSAKNLNALEEGLVDALPQPVFTRGFIRSYAQVLGLDIAEVTDMIDQVMPQNSMDNINPDSSPSMMEQTMPINHAEKSSKFPLLLLIIVAVLAVGGWFVYSQFGSQIKDMFNAENTSVNSSANYVAPAAESTERPAGMVSQPAADNTENSASHANNMAESMTELASNAAEAPSNLAGSSSAESATGGEARAQASSGSNTPAAGNVVDTAASSADAASAVSSTGDAAHSSALAYAYGDSVTNNSSSVTARQGVHNITVTAQGRCWLRAEFDGKKREAMLNSGQDFSVDFNKKMRLQLGNPSAVTVTYDDAAYSFTSVEGRSSFLYFPPSPTR